MRPSALSILEAAASVFCREGFAGANIDLIAAEAGVSRQTVYNHHGDKENLFVAVVARCHRAQQCRLLRHACHLPRPSRRPRSRPHRLRHPPEPQLHLQPRRQVPAQADPDRRRALSRAVRRLARGRPGQDLGGARRALRPARPCRPSRHRRSRRRRTSVPGARSTPTCTSPSMLGEMPDDGAGAAVRDQCGAHLPARLRRKREPLAAQAPICATKSSADA